MSTYCLVGNMFCMGKTGRTYRGPCVLGPDAIYLIVVGDCAQGQLNSGITGVGGLMDKACGLVQLVPIPGIEKFETPMDTIIEQFSNEPAFPADLIGEKAFVFPRSSIVRMRFGALAGLTFSPDGYFRVSISGSFKQRKAGIAYLQQHHWPLDTRSLFDRIRGREAA